jgi:hypothetical protein
VAFLTLASAAEFSSENKPENAVPIFRFHPGAADEVESEFHSAFDTARASFQKRLNATFLLESLFQDHQLDAKALASDRFTQVINGFQNENKSFPLTRNLAEIWATGGSDDALQKAWARPLRTVMQHYILPLTTSGEVNRFDDVLLVSVTNLAQTISSEAEKENGKEVSNPDFYTLDKAKRELELVFSSEEKPVADFLASFLKLNCASATELTQPLSTPHLTEAGVAALEEPAEIATDTKETKAEAVPAVRDPVEASEVLPGRDPVLSLFFSDQKSVWEILALIALGLVAFLVWSFKHNRKPKQEPNRQPVFKANRMIEEAAPFDVQEGFIEQPTILQQAEIEFWRNRALEAERRLETASATTRSHLMPHLARMLMDKFVQRLFSQRTALLDTQEMATLKVVEMEKQLEKIHASRESQLKAYQLRIERLEKELAAKTEENRALIRTAVQLTEAQVQMTNVE